MPGVQCQLVRPQTESERMRSKLCNYIRGSLNGSLQPVRLSYCVCSNSLVCHFWMARMFAFKLSFQLISATCVHRRFTQPAWYASMLIVHPLYQRSSLTRNPMLDTQVAREEIRSAMSIRRALRKVRQEVG